MGWIEKREGAKGTTYRLCTQDGNTVRRQAWKPEPGITQRQAEKAANAALIKFELDVQRGFLSEKMTLDELIDKWLDEYAVKQLKPRTVDGYKHLRPRISQALGQRRVDKIKPAHLMAFYDELAQPGMRQDVKYIATPELCAALNGATRAAVAQAAGIGENTARLALQGKPVAHKTALQLANVSGLAFEQAFAPAKEDNQLTASTARHYHRFLSSVFSKAVQWGIMTENPCKRVDAPKVKEQDVQMLDEEEVAALLDALQDAPPIYSTITQLALLTGCRRGELCGLRWSDVDFENATLHINRAAQWLQGQGVVFDSTKTAKSKRVIKLSSDALQLLAEWHKEQIKQRLAAGFAWVQEVDVCSDIIKNDLVFTRPDGRPLDPNAVTSWFPQFLKEHNLPAVHFHSLRHTCASLLIAAHVPVTTVSGRLGHARTSTTLDIYASSIRSADAAAADALDSVFDRIHKKQHSAV